MSATKAVRSRVRAYGPPLLQGDRHGLESAIGLLESVIGIAGMCTFRERDPLPGVIGSPQAVEGSHNGFACYDPPNAIWRKLYALSPVSHPYHMPKLVHREPSPPGLSGRVAT